MITNIDTVAPGDIDIADEHMMTPFDLGVMIAEANEGCVPEEFYLRRQDIVEYILGYLSVNDSAMAWATLAHYAPEIR